MENLDSRRIMGHSFFSGLKRLFEYDVGFMNSGFGGGLDWEDQSRELET